MKTINADAEKEIKALLANWWSSVNQQLVEATGNAIQIGAEAPVDLLFASEVGQRLVRIAQAAENGLKWSPDRAKSILADCQAFEDWINHSPLTHRTPEEFWNTPVGYLVLRARLWAELDRLVSLKEAAELSGLSLSSLSQRISRGQLNSFRDPYEPNPQRARRIRLTELESFIHFGLVRKPAIPILAKYSLPVQGYPQEQRLHTHIDRQKERP